MCLDGQVCGRLAGAALPTSTAQAALTVCLPLLSALWAGLGRSVQSSCWQVLPLAAYLPLLHRGPRRCLLASAAQGPTSPPACLCCTGPKLLPACLCCAGAPVSSTPADQLLALLELHIVIPVPVIDAVWTTPFFQSGVTLDTLLSSGWGTLPGSTPAATIGAAPASNGWVLHLLAPRNFLEASAVMGCAQHQGGRQQAAVPEDIWLQGVTCRGAPPPRRSSYSWFCLALLLTTLLCLYCAGAMGASH